MNIYLEVYGCTANKADASLAKGILKEDGHKFVNNPSDSDIIVILTCTVIDTTEQKILSRLKSLKYLDKEIIVTGCMASVQAEKLYSVIPNVKVLKPTNISQISKIIKDKNLNLKSEEKTNFTKHYDDLFAPILISEGCLFSCSYCITSIARGKLISYSIKGIKKDIIKAIEKGCKEIQLTAQDTSSYGLDVKSNLGELLKQIKDIKGQYRIRIGMMNPFTCMKNINKILNGFDSNNIYKFVHLPVQSGNNEILNLMQRKYTINDFKEIVKIFRKKYPNITLSTDIIVGFPTETDEQFQDTINLIKKIKPDITNITRFSARPFTKAKNMKGRIKTEIAKKRSKELTKICKKISLENNLEQIGKKYNVLITERGKNNTFVGRSENYKPVILKQKVNIGSFYNVNIVDAKSNYLVGRLK
jgi:MiaB-like tRNA modifying enzyme